MNARKRVFRAICCVGVVWLGAASLSARAGQVPAATVGLAGQEELLNTKRALMEANYEGNLEELARLAAELGDVADSSSLSWLARYHAGFAHYVLALMVGPGGLVSRQGDPERMLEHVEAGIRQLKGSVAENAEFADGLALLSQLYTMKYRSNPAVLSGELGPRARALLETALEIEPDNPRVVLIEAMRLFYAPPRAGGDRERGVARWREAVGLFTESGRDDTPWPSWGHAEATAWLASAQLILEPPDAVEAARLARKALELRPDFRWLRVALMPRVEAALSRSPPVRFFQDVAESPAWDVIRGCSRATAWRCRDRARLLLGRRGDRPVPWLGPASEAGGARGLRRRGRGNHDRDRGAVHRLRPLDLRWDHADASRARDRAVPLLQWILIPPLVIWFVRRQSADTAGPAEAGEDAATPIRKAR